MRLSWWLQLYLLSGATVHTHTHTVLIKQPDEWALRDMISLLTDTDIYPEKNIHGVKDALISASACLKETRFAL